ncbi:MAG: aminoglycoside phosphotransferase family protein [Reyranellaceae bacterium]
MLHIRHQLIIRHPTRPAILLTKDAGGSRLPAFVSEDRHTADVDHINREIARRFGLRTTVLRSLRHSEPLDDLVVRVHELELHGEGSQPPPGLHWCSREDLPLMGGDADDIAAWLAATAVPRAAAADGRDWTLPGWFDTACGWMAHTLAKAGEGKIQEVVQQRTWPSSCVLFVRTERGEYYFKAVPESADRECSVTSYLAQHFPGATAPVVAVEPERRWFLMRGIGGRKLEEVDDAAVWERAAAAYGELQVACQARVSDLHLLGCPTRGLDTLADEIEALLTAPTVLRPDEPGGLSADEADRLRVCGPELRRRCERLAACDISLTLEHGDLWPSNVFVDDEACAVIDWEDVAIGHPFISLAPFIVGLGMFQPGIASTAVTERVELAYVARFTGFASEERLLEALRLARPLAFIDMAIRYRGQRTSVVQIHPWMRDLVPQAIRLALAQLDREQV